MNKKIMLSGFVVLLLTWFFAPLCFAEVVSPSTQLQQVANRMITQLESNKSKLNNMNVIRRITFMLFNFDLLLSRKTT